MNLLPCLVIDSFRRKTEDVPGSYEVLAVRGLSVDYPRISSANDHEVIAAEA